MYNELVNRRSLNNEPGATIAATQGRNDAMTDSVFNEYDPKNYAEQLASRNILRANEMIELEYDLKQLESYIKYGRKTTVE